MATLHNHGVIAILRAPTVGLMLGKMIRVILVLTAGAFGLKMRKLAQINFTQTVVQSVLPQEHSGVHVMTSSSVVF